MVLNSRDEVSGLDVIKSGLSIVDDEVTTLVALLDLGQVVVSSDFKHESGDEIRDSEWVKVNILSGLEWHEKLKSGGGLLTGTEVVLFSPVGLFVSDIGLDLLSVEEPVLGNFLCDLSNVRELLGVRLESVDVILHTGAVGKGVWKVVNNLAEVLNSRDEVSGLDVIKSGLSIVDDEVTTLVALLDL